MFFLFYSLINWNQKQKLKTKNFCCWHFKFVIFSFRELKRGKENFCSLLKSVFLSPPNQKCIKMFHLHEQKIFWVLVFSFWFQYIQRKCWHDIGMVPYLYYTRLNLCKKIPPTKHEFSYIEHHISLEKNHFQIKQTQNRCAVCITETAQKLAPNK